MYERLHPLWISFSLLSTFDEKWFEIDGSGSRLRKHKEIDKHLVKLIEYIETLCASSSIDHLKSIFFDCPSSPCPSVLTVLLSWLSCLLQLVLMSSLSTCPPLPRPPSHVTHPLKVPVPTLTSHSSVGTFYSSFTYIVHYVCVQYFFVPNVQKSMIRACILQI